MATLGLILLDRQARLWSARLQWAELNRDGEDRQEGGGHSLSAGRESDVMRLFATHRRPAMGGDVELGLGVERWRDDDGNDTDLQAYLSWSTGWY